MRFEGGASLYQCFHCISACPAQITKKACEEAGVKIILLPGDLASEIVCKCVSIPAICYVLCHESAVCQPCVAYHRLSLRTPSFFFSAAGAGHKDMVYQPTISRLMSRACFVWATV